VVRAADFHAAVLAEEGDFGHAPGGGAGGIELDAVETRMGGRGE